MLIAQIVDGLNIEVYSFFQSEILVHESNLVFKEQHVSFPDKVTVSLLALVQHKCRK